MRKQTEWIKDYSMLDEMDRPFLFCTKCKSSIHPTGNIPYLYCPICGTAKKLGVKEK